MRSGCERACCSGDHPGEECRGCPYQEDPAIWLKVRLIRGCSSEINDRDGHRYYLSLESLRLALDHPALYGITDEAEAYADLQQGIAWLNGED